jgi:hypothetical protein
MLTRSAVECAQVCSHSTAVWATAMMVHAYGPTHFGVLTRL